MPTPRECMCCLCWWIWRVYMKSRNSLPYFLFLGSIWSFSKLWRKENHFSSKWAEQRIEWLDGVQSFRFILTKLVHILYLFGSFTERNLNMETPSARVLPQFAQTHISPIPVHLPPLSPLGIFIFQNYLFSTSK